MDPAPPDLLARLLAEHARTFDPRLAAPIARVGARLSRGRPPLRARTKAALEAAWLALAAGRDPLDVEVLLAARWPAAWKHGLARVLALAGFPPDPRIAAALPRITGLYPSFAAAALHNAIAALAARMTGVPMGRAPAALIAEADDDGGLARVAALWTALAARPADLELRAVLADALQAVGDPRGEYIALSADGATPAARKRAAALRAAHADAWLGAIPHAGGAVGFEGGFPTHLRLRTSGEPLLASLAEPAWLTVERLAIAEDDAGLGSLEPALEALLARAPALHTLHLESTIQGRDVPRLRGPFPRIRTLGVGSLEPDDGPRLAPFTGLQLLAVRGPPPLTRFEADLAPRPLAAGSLRSLRSLLDTLAPLRLPVLLLDASARVRQGLRAYRDAPTVAELRLAAAPGHVPGNATGSWTVRLRRGEPRAELGWCHAECAITAGAFTYWLSLLATAGWREIAAWIPEDDLEAARAEAAQVAGVAVDFTGAPIDP